MLLERAYSLLTVRAVQEETGRRRFQGWATTPETDRMGDVVDPMGAKFARELPLLHQHDHLRPIGRVKLSKPTKAGIEFEAEIPVITEPGPLKERVDLAWQEIKAGLIRAVSIGFRVLEDGIERLKEGGYRFNSYEIIELSAVTVPANAGATITEVRSIDASLRAASGKSAAVVVHTPPVAGLRNIEPKATKMPTTIAEQISAFEAKRAATVARMNDLMTKASDKGETLDASEGEQYDTMQAEVLQIDTHLKRLDSAQKANVAAARPVAGVTDPATGAATRISAPIQVKANLPPGTAFVRYTIALCRAHGNIMQAAEIAKHEVARGAWDNTPQVETILRTAVAAGTTTDSAWAAPLWDYQQMSGEFVELLRPATIIGRLTGLRRVPFNIQMPRTTSGTSVNWVGQGKAKPMTKMQFETITLGQTKAAGIVALTEELVRASNPSAEAVVSADLRAAMAQFLDQQFIDPDIAAVADTSPASITYGATSVVASGTDADAFRYDAGQLLAGFATANLSLGGSVWIMSERIAIGLSLLTNALGQPEFPGMTPTGGTLLGLPVVASEAVQVYGSPVADRDIVILAKPSEILLADDGQVMIDASREATLQMDDSPAEPTADSTVLVSMWQRNMVALRAERWINWRLRRTTAVQFIRQAAYGPTAS